MDLANLWLWSGLRIGPQLMDGLSAGRSPPRSKEEERRRPLWCESVCILTTRLTLKIGKAFSTSLHLWLCIRIPITIIVTGQPNLFQNTGILTIILVVQINNMVAHFTILFVLRSYCFRKIPPNPTGIMWIKMEWSGDCFSDILFTNF